MSKKGKHLLTALVLTAALTVNTGTSAVWAAAAENAQTVETNAAESAENQKTEEPAVPESYEWEIQSNSIAGWPEGPKVVAETAILMDVDTGEILYAKGIDEKRAPASTTKIMTAMLALEKVPFDTQITFTNEVNNIEADSTHIGIKPGETLTMKDCAYAILLASANEVSSGVAEYIGGTVPAFIDMMNQRAKELGCENTNFVNANGLYSEDHYTTAKDLAVISREAFKNETFREIIKTPYYIVPKTNITDEERWLNNHHKMVLDGAEHYDGCLGGKTGYTVKAGNTLVTYAQRNGMTLVCVILADINEHYNDTRAIFDYGFNNFKKLDSASAELMPASSSDGFSTFLYEQGLLETAFGQSSMDVPVDLSKKLTYDASLENNLLSIDYYYGDTLLGTSSQEASADILAAAETYDLQARQTSQLSESASESDASASDSSLSEATDTKDTSSKGSSDGFWGEFWQNFQELPSWKYPAALLLLAALIFYLVTLIVKIRRAAKKRKRKKLRQMKAQKEDETS